MKYFSAFIIFVVVVPSIISDQEYFDNEPNEYLLEDENGTLTYQNSADVLGMRSSFSDDQVVLFLYTIDNFDNPIRIRINNLDDIKASSMFNRKRDNLFIIHGYLNNYKSDVNKFIRTAILKSKYDLNIFCVDWSDLASSPWYPNSARAVAPVGDNIGNFINSMMKNFNLSPSKFKFAGHSLGAHVSGRTGFRMKQKPDYIVGLDPAAPNFGDKPDEIRLDITDANFVQVIHTNGALYGIIEGAGHADYYPNNGYKQPGCLLNTCSHSRSWQYFAESIEFGGFSAKLCDSYERFKEGHCQHNGNSFMGRYEIDKRAYGDYFLDTNKESPFSKDS